MLKKNSKYWLDRQAMEKEAIEKYIKQDQEAIAQLNKHYDTMLNNINQQIAAEISSLAERNNVGLELAKKQVTQMDVQAYSSKAKKLVEQAAKMRKEGHRVTYKDYSDAVNQELRVYNTTMRINRLEYLRANIALEVARASLNAASITGNTLVDRYIAETKRQSGILGISGKNDSMLNNAAIQGVVTADVNGANWSSRLWANQVGLRASLEQVLATGLAHFDIKRMQSLMTNTVHNWRYVADRLLNTEVSRVLYMAQWGSIKKAGYRFVKWINEPKACLLCSAIGRADNGYGSGIYEYDKVPSIPTQTHPNCRCAISAYWVDDNQVAQKEKGLGSYRVGTNKVNMDYIHSQEFKTKFDKISDNPNLNQQLRKQAIAILTHRNGTDGEDSYIFDEDGNRVAQSFGKEGKLEVGYSKKDLKRIHQNYSPYTLIGMHNHPTNIPPSGSDFAAANNRNYNYGIVVTHEGKIYKYSLKSNQTFLPNLLDMTLAKIGQINYNLSEDQIFDKAMNELQGRGFKCVEIK